jgi:hypothetical protein
VSDDAIECRVRLWAVEKRPLLRVTIGDTTFEFPEGTTREEVRAVLDEAKARYLKLKLVP